MQDAERAHASHDEYSLTGPAEAPRRYHMKYTGCGNSLTFDGPAVIRRFFNGGYDSKWVTLPPLGPDRAWHRAIDTSLRGGGEFAETGSEVPLDPPNRYIVNPRSTVALIAQQPKGAKRG